MFTSQMMSQEINIPNNPTKKLPNPANYKIVKCKNFERGKLYVTILLFKEYTRILF